MSEPRFTLEDVASMVDNEGLYYLVTGWGLRSDRVPVEIEETWQKMEEHMLAAEALWQTLEGVLPEPWEI